MSSENLPAREGFLSAFQTVCRITANGCSLGQDLLRADFFLEDGRGVLGDYSSSDGKAMGLTEWLRRVREDEPRPTFLFPENAAGPDLMFVFRCEIGKDEREIDDANTDRGDEQKADKVRRLIFAIQVGVSGLPPAATFANLRRPA